MGGIATMVAQHALPMQQHFPGAFSTNVFTNTGTMHWALYGMSRNNLVDKHRTHLAHSDTVLLSMNSCWHQVNMTSSDTLSNLTLLQLQV
jgi:hypothetical protein